MSDSVALHGFGGGTGLNYLVKAYSSEAEMAIDKPRENTIGIITDTAITSHVFSMEEPGERSGGMVWIVTGLFSTAAFSATRHNPIMLYPTMVKQFDAGEWHIKTAKTYQDGEWVDWANYLIKEGKLLRKYTTSDSLSLSEDDGSVKLSSTNGEEQQLIFQDVDLTGRTIIKAKGTFVALGESTARLCVWTNERIDPNGLNTVLSQVVGDREVILSVEDLNGLHKVGWTTAYYNVEAIADLYIY